MWEVILSKKAQEDLKKLKSIGLFEKTKELVAILGTGQLRREGSKAA